jgi:AhpD family alkylhydroperoxidase
MYTRMANSAGAFETYLYGYERFRKDSGFSPAEQEVVLLSISAENGCEYCVAAHSTLADGPSKVPREVTDAIRSGSPVPDVKLRALSELTRAIVATRGRPLEKDVRTFLAAGYAERHILELVLAVAVKTISNYVNHLFETPVDDAFKARAWSAPARSAA